MEIDGKEVKLPIKFKQKWIDALNSGKYKQGKNSLYRNNSFCCLGVAAKVCEIGNNHIYNKALLDEKSNLKNAWNRIRKRLPKALRENKSLQVILVEKNDDVGESFKKIAKYIEKNL